MFRNTSKILIALVILTVLLVQFSSTATPAVAQTSYTFFPGQILPSPATNDGRMLAVAGIPQQTLAGTPTEFEFASPASQGTIQIGVFDGDTGGSHWDVGTTQLIYTLYADPLANGSTAGGVIGTWKGNAVNPTSGSGWVASSATMPDNDWWNLTVANTPAALSIDGKNYFYHMHVEIENNATNTNSAFKVRTTGSLSLLSDSTWAFEGQLRPAADIPIIYPKYAAGVANDFFLNAVQNKETTYDGTWAFYANIPKGMTALPIWDGDFDFGTNPAALNSYGAQGKPSGVVLSPCVDKGTTPDFPPFDYLASNTIANSTPQPNGGDPADDGPADFSRRSPCVYYTVTNPQGKVYTNNDPSGNKKWELFNIREGGAVLPDGIWRLDIIGMDMDNLSFFHFPACGITADGKPNCAPVYGSIGDFVWIDWNGNGVQDAGESGINGVTVKLLNSSGQVIATTTTANNPTTGAPGYYLFNNLAAGNYKVQFIAPNGYGFTLQYAQGTDATMSNNNDSNPAATGASVGTTDTITLGSAQNNLTIDAGLLRNLCGYIRTPGFWKNYSSHMTDATFMNLINHTQDFAYKLTLLQAVTILSQNSGTSTVYPGVNALDLKFLLASEINAVWNGNDNAPGLGGELGAGMYQGNTVNYWLHLAYVNGVLGKKFTPADHAYVVYLSGGGEGQSAIACKVRATQ